MRQIIARRDFLKRVGAAGMGSLMSGCQSAWFWPKAVYPGWQEGEMDIHFVYTGCGENMFFRFPDGTSVLHDTGDFYRPKDLGEVPLLPSPDRLGGDWMARYVKRVFPERTIDYAIFSHWHIDHIGHAVFDRSIRDFEEPDGAFRYRMTADGRKINGFLCVAEEFSFRRYLDHQYPTRGIYRSQDSSMDLLAPWIEREKTKGLVAEPFRVGALDQIALLHNPAKYRGVFSVRNIFANGILWDGESGVRDFAAEHVVATGRDTIPQNMLSLGFVVQYGRFRFYTGGDVQKSFQMKDGTKFDYEGAIGERVGTVSLCKMNHHGCRDAMCEAFVKAVRSQVYVSCMWCPTQAHHEVLGRIHRIGAHDGSEPLILPGLVGEFQKQGETKYGYFLPPCGAYHIVIKVFPGGDRYRVYLLDPRDEKMCVLSEIDCLS